MSLSKGSPRPFSTSLRVEALESRDVPAVTASFYHWSGELTVTSDNAADRVEVLDTRYGNVGSAVNGGPRMIWAETSVKVNGVAQRIDAFTTAGYQWTTRLDHANAKPTVIRVNGGGGDDTILVDQGGVWGGTPAVVLDGGEGNDTITGSVLGDTIYGGGGIDTILAGDGNDWIDAGAGNDGANGGTGHDTIYGGSGGDTLYGWTGNDYMDGGTEGDQLYGGDDHDTLIDGAGVTYDFLSGENGDDRVLASDGGDILYGGFGNDTLSGGWGGDYLYGEDGLDYLDGGGEGDQLYGGNDDDTLADGGGDTYDYLDGQNGNDILNASGGGDRLYGGYGSDTLNGGDGGDYLYGQWGVDHLNGGAHGDQLYGGDDTDYLRAGEGDVYDYLDGEAGNDFLWGGGGDDVLLGGIGDDKLWGENGNDQLFGQAGNDELNGGAGLDRLEGGGEAGDRLRPDDAPTQTTFTSGGTTVVDPWMTYGGGMAVRQVGTSGGLPTFPMPAVSSLDLLGEWRRARPALQSQLVAAIGGVGATNVSAALTDTPLVSLSNARNDGTVQVRMMATNSVIAGTLGPIDFAIRFNVEVKFTLSVSNGQLVVSPPVIYVWDIDIDGTNFLGDVVDGFYDVFGGIVGAADRIHIAVNAAAGQHLAPPLRTQLDAMTTQINSDLPVELRPLTAGMSLTFDVVTRQIILVI